MTYIAVFCFLLILVTVVFSLFTTPIEMQTQLYGDESRVNDKDVETQTNKLLAKIFREPEAHVKGFCFSYDYAPSTDGICHGKITDITPFNCKEDTPMMAMVYTNDYIVGIHNSRFLRILKKSWKPTFRRQDGHLAGDNWWWTGEPKTCMKELISRGRTTCGENLCDSVLAGRVCFMYKRKGRGEETVCSTPENPDFYDDYEENLPIRNDFIVNLDSDALSAFNQLLTKAGADCRKEMEDRKNAEAQKKQEKMVKEANSKKRKAMKFVES